MLSIITGIFFVLHGLVHMLYYGQSIRLFELQPGMRWPDGSWTFTKPFGMRATRSLAGIFCILAALGFIAGGIGLFISQDWWRPVAIGSAIFSSAGFLLLWDGKVKALANKGLIGILINVAILVAVLVFRWPYFGA